MYKLHHSSFGLLFSLFTVANHELLTISFHPCTHKKATTLTDVEQETDCEPTWGANTRARYYYTECNPNWKRNRQTFVYFFMHFRLEFSPSIYYTQIGGWYFTNSSLSQTNKCINSKSRLQSDNKSQTEFTAHCNRRLIIYIMEITQVHENYEIFCTYCVSESFPLIFSVSLPLYLIFSLVYWENKNITLRGDWCW